tara:strand:+ start:177 stop:3413 length:3237 start_codon:yes stop_codon:yes gene_type:complete
MSDVSVVVGDLPGPQPDVNLPVLPEADPVYPQEEGEPLRMTVTRGVPKEEVEQVAPVALPQDEYQDEDWVRSYHGRRMDSRRVLTGPDAQDFESQGIDPRNLLDDNAFDNAVKFYDRVMEPYAEVGRTILDVNQETGRALASGMYSAAQGFIDTTGEIAELLADVTGVDPYVIWDDQGLRLTDERPDDYEPYTLPKFFTDPQTMVGQIGADLTQFVAAMGAFSLGTLGAIPSGTVRFMALGAVADSLFDPEEGNFSTMLMELGVEPNVVLEYLGTPVGEDAGAAERLGQRIKNAFEGAAIGLPFDLAVPVFKAFQALKGNPDILQRALTHLEAAGERAALRIEERAAGRSTTLGMGIDPGEIVDPALKLMGQAITSPPLSRREVGAINKAVGRGKLNTAARAEAERIKGEYPVAEGWMPLEVAGVIKNKDGTIKAIKFKQPAYAFHNPPEGVTTEEWRQQLTSAMVDDVKAIVERARGGDEAANAIVQQAAWYRAMRARLRSEFGGIGDVFADLLGSTSAQTGVEQNWDNAIEILRRFSLGEYDAEIAAFSKRVEAGEDISSKILHPLDKAGEFPLIRSAAGSLFNANSPAATGALLDLFRQIKVGSSPKTPNFTGNLIGYTNDATIDVWAARYLRGIAGLERIPPPAEKAVAGKHLVGSTLDEPRIGGEFGFGQGVFEGAAREINADGFVKEYAPGVGDLGPDDLQAVVWFMEKEKWAANGWTTKAGEGGSLDFEASFAGQPDQARIKELRRLINKGFTDKKYEAPKRKKGEGDAAYETRTTEHRKVFDQKELDRRTAFDQQRQEAEAELAQLPVSLERTTLGISSERPGDIPSNYRQAEVAAEFDDVVRDDELVVAYKANSTIGRFMNVDERALDVELVTRQGFDPEPLTRRLVELGKKYDQDSVFISKVVDSTHENARPGIEIYFRKRVDMDVVNKVTELLNANEIDGFTFVTDMRQGDRVNVQAMAGGEDTAGITGIRMQYIPEYDETFDAALRAEKMAEIEVKYGLVVSQLMREEPIISAADVLHYDTKIFSRDDYDGYLGSSFADTRTEVGERRPRATVTPQQSDGPRADSP